MLPTSALAAASTTAASAFSYDSTDGERFYPANLWRFGKTPYNQTLYRVVWAPSRRFVGKTPSGQFQSFNTYLALGEAWVLEKWLSPLEYAGCGADRWYREFPELGPYPIKGEYCYCLTIPGAPADCNFDKLIALVELKKKRSRAEMATQMRDDIADEKRDNRQQMMDRIGEALPAFGLRSFVGGKVSRGTKTDYPLRVAASRKRNMQPGGFSSTAAAKPPKKVVLARD